MKDLESIQVTEEQYLQLKEFCKHDFKFPKSWVLWNELMKLAALQVASAQMQPSSPFPVDPAKFSAWCTKVEVTPCIDALRAYMILHRSQPHRTITAGSRLTLRQAI